MRKLFGLNTSKTKIFGRLALPVASFTLAVAVTFGCSGKSAGDGKIEAGGMTETAEARSSGDPKPAISIDKYAAWDTLSAGNVKILYPSGHPLAESFQSTAEGYPHAVKRICDFLTMTPPRETLLVYYYTGVFHGRAVTGFDYAFAVDSTIHFWLPGYLGPTLAEYVLGRWIPTKTKHRFLKDGMMTLFDFSGQNYFEFVDSLIKHDSLISLSQLAVDTAINVFSERWQSAEAATFVDFVVYTWGPEGLKALWLNQDSFDKAVPKIFGISVDEMQTMWLEFVRKINAGTLESDSASG